MPPPQPSPAIRIAGEGVQLPLLSLLSDGGGLGWGPRFHRSLPIDFSLVRQRLWLGVAVILFVLAACSRQPTSLPTPAMLPSPTPGDGGTAGVGVSQPKPMDVRFDSAENTVIVSGNGQLSLPMLLGALPNDKVLTETVKGQGEWLLSANVRIDTGATLNISGPDVKWLKLRSDAGGFVSIKAMGGALAISDTKITSWDAGANDVDVVLDDGRSFVLARNGGRMDIRKSELSHLGYEANESYGVAWRMVGTTGSAEDSVFAENFYGLYLHEASGVVIRGNTVRDNVRYGIDPHSRSNHLLIENNSAYGNGKQGIILAEGCSDSVIRGNKVYKNAMHGIVIFNDSNNNVIENNISYGNALQGINIKNSISNTVQNNLVYENTESGIGLGENARNNLVTGNTVRDNTEHGIYAYSGATGNQIGQNEVYGNTQNGIYIKSEGNVILPGNTVYGNTIGVYLRVPQTDSSFRDTNKIYDNREENVRVKP